MPKKLQVFVSSTYVDMREERQAAVEAILQAGHIPAGMELFTAGDKSQWEVIKRWIKESDAFMLILGTRYGTIDTDTKKSYIEMEYDFALSENKPFFAVVMSPERCKTKIQEKVDIALDQSTGPQLIEFRKRVESKMVKHFGSLDQLKLGILTALKDVVDDPRTKGWVPASEALSPATAQEIARLSQENNEFRKQLEVRAFSDDAAIGALIEEMKKVRSEALPGKSIYDLFLSRADNFERGLWKLAINEVFQTTNSAAIDADIGKLEAYEVIEYGANSFYLLTSRGRSTWMKIRRDAIRRDPATTDSRTSA
jgi:hypothetical protein